MRSAAPRARAALGIVIGALALALGAGAMYMWEQLSGDAAPAPPTASASVLPSRDASPEPSATPSEVLPAETPSPTASGQSTTGSAFSKHSYVLHLPVSPWVVVNKLRPLQPQDHVPPALSDLSAIPGGGDEYLIPEAATALHDLYVAADAAGAGFRVSTAYRSYSRQQGIFNDYVADWGTERAETYVARPGYSEHQTGRAVDIYTTAACKLAPCFADTAASQWVAAHGHEFGFIVRYPANMQAITGYEYEPWHLRYVGVDLATEMFVSGPATMEEFFGLPAAPDYAD